MKHHNPLTKPSVANISYLLRHRELWPKDFEWYYGRTCSCAIGLSAEFWDVNNNEVLNIVTNEIGLLECDRAFYNALPDGVTSDVTPEDVAAILDGEE